jgi:selenocysteine lyase/cysteine desulfurase
VSPHVYNDQGDIRALTAALREVVRSPALP